MFQLARKQNAVQPQRHPEQVALELNEQELAETSGSFGGGDGYYYYCEGYSRYGEDDDDYDRCHRHHRRYRW